MRGGGISLQASVDSCIPACKNGAFARFQTIKAGFADSRISARPPNELARLPFFMNQMLSQRLLVLPPPDDYCDQHDICDNNANVRYNSYDLHFLPPLPVTIYIDNEP